MSGRRATFFAVAYAILGVLPLFLVSAQAVQLQRDLGFGKVGLGLAVSLCFLASAATATPLGHLVHRIGPSAGLRLSASLSLAALLVMALVASTWWHVACALALTGIANATAQVSTNVVLASGVSPARQGVAFGAKQAAIPIASLAAGLALPLVGLLAGWATAFAAAAAVVSCAVAFGPRFAPRHEDRRERASASTTPLLMLLAVCGGLAGAVGNAIPTFTVDSAVSRGIEESVAGLLLAAGSVASIVGRIGSGWVADRRRSVGISELAALTGVGALACALLAVSGDSEVLFMVAIVTAFGAGWGWAGVIYFAVVRTHAHAPAAASGFVLSVVYVGNVIGPAGVGLIAEHASYELAWTVGAVVLALATVAALGARRLAQRAPRHAVVEAPAV